MPISREVSFKGCLLGTAVGDSLGLPVEFLSPAKARRFHAGGLKQKLFLNHGMVSDDTDHSAFAAISLIRYPTDQNKFARHLSWRLRWWLLSLPAGVGFATLRSILKLWMGFSPDHSGVHSAGNGPAMRAPIIGAFFQDNHNALVDFVKSSTLMTHNDPRALQGAIIVAMAAAFATKGVLQKPRGFSEYILDLIPDMDADFRQLFSDAIVSAEKNEKLETFIDKNGWKNGISGFINHTVSAVIQVWLRNQHDFRGAMEEIIGAGGDTDTTAAILGGIVGAALGPEGIPLEWRSRIMEWPRSMTWLERLGSKLAVVCETGKGGFPPYYMWYFVPVRNLFFILVILLQVVRRIFL